MKYAELLALEYQEQYNQYRWIGTMQSVVLTFFGVVTSAILLIMTKFLGEDPSFSDLLWPSRVAIILGIIGICVSIGLVKSRGMQNRTARYLAALVFEMAKHAEDPSIPEKTSLRYRGLCSSKGRFAFLDTSNIATFLALVFSVLLGVAGAAINYLIEVKAQSILVIGWRHGILLFLLLLCVSWLLLHLAQKSELQSVDCDFNYFKNKIGLKDSMKTFGFEEE